MTVLCSTNSKEAIHHAHVRHHVTQRHRMYSRDTGIAPGVACLSSA